MSSAIKFRCSEYERPSIEAVNLAVAYFPCTGIFIWNGGPRQGRPAGSITSGGYVQIRVGGRVCGAHRLAWLLVNGVWPTNVIDHLNGVRHDNKISNLRDVSRGVNVQNVRHARVDNASTGMLGVERRGHRFRARIQVDGRMVAIGVYDTPDEAHQCYLAAKRRLHEGCTV